MTKRSSSSKTAFNGIGGEQNPADSDGTRVHRQEASDGESGKRKRSESSRERKREKGDEAAHKDTRKRKERPALEENEKGAAEPCRGGSQASVTPTTLRYQENCFLRPYTNTHGVDHEIIALVFVLQRKTLTSTKERCAPRSIWWISPPNPASPPGYTK